MPVNPQSYKANYSGLADLYRTTDATSGANIFKSIQDSIYRDQAFGQNLAKQELAEQQQADVRTQRKTQNALAEKTYQLQADKVKQDRISDQATANLYMHEYMPQIRGSKDYQKWAKDKGDKAIAEGNYSSKATDYGKEYDSDYLVDRGLATVSEDGQKTISSDANAWKQVLNEPKKDKKSFNTVKSLGDDGKEHIYKINDDGTETDLGLVYHKPDSTTEKSKWIDGIDKDGNKIKTLYVDNKKTDKTEQQYTKDTDKSSFKYSTPRRADVDDPVHDAGTLIMDEIVNGKKTGNTVLAPETGSKNTHTPESLTEKYINDVAEKTGYTKEQIRNNPSIMNDISKVASSGKDIGTYSHRFPMHRKGVSPITKDGSTIDGRKVTNKTVPDAKGNLVNEIHRTEAPTALSNSRDYIEKLEENGQENFAETLENYNENFGPDTYNFDKLYGMVHTITGGDEVAMEKIFKRINDKGAIRDGGIGSILASYTPSIVDWNEGVPTASKERIMAYLFNSGKLEVNNKLGQGGLDDRGNYSYSLRGSDGKLISNPEEVSDAINKMVKSESWTATAVGGGPVNRLTELYKNIQKHKPKTTGYNKTTGELLKQLQQLKRDKLVSKDEAMKLLIEINTKKAK